MAGDADGDGGRLVQKEGLQFLVEGLLDEGQPISERFRALFALRNHRGEPARSALIRAMRDTSDLLAHEAAFALGQMQDAEAVPDLVRVLFDFDGCRPIVRHEAAEALGAVGDAASIEILQKSLLLDPAQEVRETCELAVHRLKEHGSESHEEDESSSSCPFLSVDPAMPAPKGAATVELREMLLDEKAPMHSRYAALFALRNRGSSDAVEAIVATLESSQSALLKHEIAYVLGQLQDKRTMESLVGILENPEEHPMVRHEAAEALGSIGDARCLELLKRYAHDPEPLVQQSCEVALSMLEFEQQGKPFEYLFQELKALS